MDYAKYLILLLIPFLLGGSKLRATGSAADGTSYVDYCADANCVGCWRFNGAEVESLLDISSEDNHGTNSDATFTTDGSCKENNCYSYDGGDYIDIGNPDSLDITTAISIVAWVYPTALPGADAGYGIYTKDEVGAATRRYNLAIHTSGGGNTFRLFLKNSSASVAAVDSNSAAATNTWSHVAGTWDGTNMKIYVNGEQQTDTDTLASPLSSDDPEVRIGEFENSAASRFHGLIDELAVFNDELTAAEVKDIYIHGLR